MGELQDILVNIGAIAGFAAIVGLAVLAMLYFSQARDVRRLREWAGREPERAGEVELRAQQIASQAIAQAYESMALRQSEAAAAAGIAEEQGVAVAEMPIVVEPGLVEPVAVEAALAEAEQSDEELDPHATQAHDVLDDAQLIEEGVLAADPVVGEDGEQVYEENADAAHEDDELAADDEAQPVTHDVAAAANGSGSDTVIHPGPVHSDQPGQLPPVQPEQPQTSHLAPSTPAAARAATPLPPLPPLDTSEFQAVRPATPPIPDYYLSTGTTGSGHFDAIEVEDANRRSRVPFAVAGVLVAIFAVILIATQLTGGTEKEPTPQERREQREAQAPSTGERNQEVNRPAVTISLLNGTSTPGLAKLGADALAKADFTDVTTGNRNDGVDYTDSTVYYASGSKIEAQEVAKELDIKNVKEADEETLAAGGSVPVIVVLGADFDQ